MNVNITGNHTPLAYGKQGPSQTASGYREMRSCSARGRSTILTSQLPVDQWHEYLNDPTLADAILDRVIHQSHRLALKGESLRKQTVEKGKS